MSTKIRPARAVVKGDQNLISIKVVAAGCLQLPALDAVAT